MVPSKLLDCSWASFRAVLEHCSRPSGSKRGDTSFSIDSLDICDYYYWELHQKKVQMAEHFLHVAVISLFPSQTTKDPINRYLEEKLIHQGNGSMFWWVHVGRTVHKDTHTNELLIIKNGSHQETASQAVFMSCEQVSKYLTLTARCATLEGNEHTYLCVMESVLKWNEQWGHEEEKVSLWFKCRCSSSGKVKVRTSCGPVVFLLCFSSKSHILADVSG